MNLLEYPFDSDTILKKKKSIKKELLSSGEANFIEKKIAILGGSTTTNIKLILELFLLNYGIKPEFYEAEYNQYYQELMFPNPELKEFCPDIIYIHTTSRNIIDWPVISAPAEEVDEMLQREYGKYAAMWDKAQSVYNCVIIQNNFEYPCYRLLGNMDATDVHGKVSYVTRLNMLFSEYARTHNNFYIQDINYLSASYGLDNWSDPFYWHMYKYAPAVPAIPELASNLAHMIKALYGKNKKVVVLDMDNTLWGGVIGDDGAENIEIGQETSLGQVYAEFQAYLKEHLQIGVLLCVNSKNDLDNALSGLKRPDSVLKEEDFQIIKANWEPKSKNMQEIAAELNLIPESMLFVDDNPAEREIVRNSISGCAVPEVEKPEYFIKILDKSGFFEVTNLSEDDLKRNEMYKKNIERVKEQSEYTDYNDYLHSLNMKAATKSFESVYMARIAQLTNKSNQFNLTTKRYTQAEIEETAADPEYITLYGKLEDKFGDNGVVSVVIGKTVNTILHIELWIMSCRVLKRDMEYAMMDSLAAKCLQKGITEIRGYYYPTKKNGMVKDFYQKQGFEKIKEDAEGNTEWSLLIDQFYEKKNHVIEVEED